MSILRRAAAVLASLAATAAVAHASPLAPPTAVPPAGPTIAPLTATPQLTRPDLEAWLDGFVPYALERADAAGAVVAIVKDGQPLLVKGYGYADVDAGRLMTGDLTVIRPGSVSKLFTWTAVMQLVEQGRIDLDRDVNAYLDFKLPARPDGPITMRRLMTHTPGFEETVGGLLFYDPQRLEPLGATLKRWTPQRIFPAGSTPAYSNYGAALAGYIVQRVSGQPYEAYVERNILKPLGMDHSTMAQPLPKALQPLMSHGYQVASRSPKPFELISMPPAGSLSSTGEDMARFMIAHLEDERGAGLLLAPETARLMHRPAGPALGPLNRMTLGFFEANLNGRRVIGHGGDTMWFHSELSLFLDDGVGLYFGMNSAGKADASIQVRTALLHAFADRYFPGQQVQGAVDPASAGKHAAALAGVYENSRRSQSNFMSALGLLGQMKVITNPDGTISVTALRGLDGEPRRWREIAPYVWKDVAGPWRLAAETRDGRVTRFSMDQISPIMVLEPPPWWRSSAWLTPALLASLAALILTALLWPVTALARRGHTPMVGLAPSDRRAARTARIAAIATVAVIAGWAFVLGTGVSDLEAFSGRLQPAIAALGLAGPVLIALSLAAVIWNAVRAWSRARPAWAARIWSLVLVVSVVVVAWTIVVFRLFGLNSHF
ncbi:MAG TPA: serine hydrolase domain-containing protein [Phenylobacterium sp.]|nr:serine hydrolase domain-containing protein [Phenylobacterium sp.]